MVVWVAYRDEGSANLEAAETGPKLKNSVVTRIGKR